MPHRILRRYTHYDLVVDGPHRLYVNKAGDPITVQIRPGRRPQIIVLIDEYGISAAKAEPGDDMCSVGKDVDGRWWGWAPSSRTDMGVVNHGELKSLANK